MTQLLHLIASPRGASSLSRRLTAEVVAAARVAAGERVHVDEWDLWSDTLPTFGRDEVTSTGYHGLLRDRTAVVAYTSAVYAPGMPPAFGRDFHASYFDDWLAFAGITDVRTLRLQPTRPASEGYAAREATALARARTIGTELSRESAEAPPERRTST